MYKGSASGWHKSNESNKTQSPRVTGGKCTSQWTAHYSSKVNWQSVPTFYSTFKTQNSPHYTLQKPLTGSMLIFWARLISSPLMAKPMDVFQQIHSSLVRFCCPNKSISCISGESAAFLVMSALIYSLKSKLCPRTNWDFGGSEVTKSGLVKCLHLRVLEAGGFTITCVWLAQEMLRGSVERLYSKDLAKNP